jgi:hypothetical protein
MKIEMLAVVALLGVAGCGAAAPWVPLTATAAPAPELTLVWVGRGECERYEGGAWVRRPEFDYDFTVEQRRLGDRWESVKSLRRRHPAYDGSAGERAQTYFFALAWGRADGQGRLPAALTSSLGNGEATSDREFRRAEMTFRAAGVSGMAPFDRYRITQRYDYEAGRLNETVELNKGTTGWVRNREVATLFAEHRFDRAPTAR